MVSKTMIFLALLFLFGGGVGYVLGYTIGYGDAFDGARELLMACRRAHA